MSGELGTARAAVLSAELNALSDRGQRMRRASMWTLLGAVTSAALAGALSWVLGDMAPTTVLQAIHLPEAIAEIFPNSLPIAGDPSTAIESVATTMGDMVGTLATIGGLVLTSLGLHQVWRALRDGDSTAGPLMLLFGSVPLVVFSAVFTVLSDSEPEGHRNARAEFVSRIEHKFMRHDAYKGVATMLRDFKASQLAEDYILAQLTLVIPQRQRGPQTIEQQKAERQHATERASALRDQAKRLGQIDVDKADFAVDPAVLYAIEMQAFGAPASNTVTAYLSETRRNAAAVGMGRSVALWLAVIAVTAGGGLALLAGAINSRVRRVRPMFLMDGAAQPEGK